MRKYLFAGLIVANVVGLVLLCGAIPSGRADSGLAVEDLTYGAIDIDGDAAYTYGDDYFVEWLARKHPQHLAEALRQAVVRPDGGVDLSPYLGTFTAESVEQAK